MKNFFLFCLLIPITIIISTGCQTKTIIQPVEVEKEVPVEVLPLSRVSDIVIVGGTESAIINWSNPSAKSFGGIQVDFSLGTTSLEGFPVKFGTNENACSITGLSAKTDYIYKITVLDADGNPTEFVTTGIFTTPETKEQISQGTPDIPEITTPVTDTTPPAPVQNFVADAADGAVILTWTNPDDADFYGVKITAKPAQGPFEKPIILLNQSTSFKAGGLTNGTSYTFKITTLDKSLNENKDPEVDSATPFSNPEISEEDTTPPAQVSNLSATCGEGSAILTWENPSDPDFFGVEISAIPAAGSLKLPVILKGQNASTFVANLPTNSYSFTVKTLDNNFNESSAQICSGSVELSSSSSVVTPGNPVNLTAEGKNESVILNWTNPEGEFWGILISAKISLLNTVENPKLGALSSKIAIKGSPNTYTVFGLTNGAKYDFTVQAINVPYEISGGSTITTSPVSSADVTPPSKVNDISFVQADSKIELSWDEPEDADYYGQLISCSPAEGTLSNPVIVFKGTTSFIASELTNGKEYTFTLVSLDQNLNQSGERTKHSTPVDLSDHTPPAEVTNFNISTADSKLTLNWTNPEDSDFYGVQITASSSASLGSVAAPVILHKEITTYTAYGLTNGAEYSFKISTLDNSLNFSTGITNSSIPVADIADTTPPAQVSDFTVSSKNCAAKLTWTDPSDSDLYALEISYTPTVSGRSILFTPNSTIRTPSSQPDRFNYCTIADLTNGTEYTFTITALDTSGNRSSVATTKATPKAGIMEINFDYYNDNLAKNQVKTTSDVYITVEFDTVDSITSAKFIKGTEDNAAKVLSDEDAVIISVKANKATFRVTDNGNYTVAAIDKAGRRECATFAISNIDRIAPANVTNLTAKYRRYQKKIITEWKDPEDEDYVGSELQLYKKVNNNLVKVNENPVFIEKGIQSYEFTGIDEVYTTYVLKVQAKDDLNNKEGHSETSLYSWKGPLYIGTDGYIHYQPADQNDDGSFTEGEDIKLEYTNFVDITGQLVNVAAESYGSVFSTANKNPVTVNDFRLASSETTAQFWSYVIVWAEQNGYKLNTDVDFKEYCTPNLGITKSYLGAGSYSNTYTPAISGTAISRTKFNSYTEPVSNLRYRDIIVWLNALSEAVGLTPVYYSDPEYTNPIRTSYITPDDATNNTGLSDSSANYGSTDAPYIYSTDSGNTDTKNCTASGFRLPTPEEWEFAAREGDCNTARWKYKYSGSPDSSTTVFNPLDCRTGPSPDYYSYSLSQYVSKVNTLSPNRLGLYDMTGNIQELCSDLKAHGGNFVAKDTDCYIYTTYVNVTYISKDNTYTDTISSSASPISRSNLVGFRIARNADSQCAPYMAQ